MALYLYTPFPLDRMVQKTTERTTNAPAMNVRIRSIPYN